MIDWTNYGIKAINVWGNEPYPTCKCCGCGMVMPTVHLRHHVCPGDDEIARLADDGCPHSDGPEDFVVDSYPSSSYDYVI